MGNIFGGDNWGSQVQKGQGLRPGMPVKVVGGLAPASVPAPAPASRQLPVTQQGPRIAAPQARPAVPPSPKPSTAIPAPEKVQQGSKADCPVCRTFGGGRR
jgi:hypothetical protein